MQVLSYDDDFLPRDSFEAQNQRRRRRRRRHHRASSCCGVPISLDLRIDGFTGKSFTYDRLPQQPFKLTVRKLDGSSFDVVVAKAATVAELKQAVEGIFSHMQREGPGKISWSHVWGHFCLCYDGWKLLADSEPISNYGINDGDELHFVRHVSVSYNLIKRRSKDRLSDLEQPMISDAFVEKEQNGEKDDSSDGQDNSKHRHYDDGNDDIMRCYEMKLAPLFRGWFSYRRLGSPGKRSEGNSFSSRLTDGFLGSCRSIARLCSSNKLYSRRDLEEEI